MEKNDTKRLLEDSLLDRALLLWWLGRYPNRKDGVGLNRYDSRGFIGRRSQAVRCFVWDRVKDKYRAWVNAETDEDEYYNGCKYDQAVIDAVKAWLKTTTDEGWGYKMPTYWRQYDKYLSQRYVKVENEG